MPRRRISKTPAQRRWIHTRASYDRPFHIPTARKPLTVPVNTVSGRKAQIGSHKSPKKKRARTYVPLGNNSIPASVPAPDGSLCPQSVRIGPQITNSSVRGSRRRKRGRGTIKAADVTPRSVRPRHRRFWYQFDTLQWQCRFFRCDTMRHTIRHTLDDLIGYLYDTKVFIHWQGVSNVAFSF